MDFGFLYAATAGRISRKTWWLGVIGFTIIALVVNLLVSSIGSMAGLASTAFGLGVLTFITLVILFVPYRALTLKRLHDRSRPEILFWAFFAPSALSALLMMIGLTGSMQTMVMFGQTVPAFRPNGFGVLFSVIQLGVGLWALFELGIAKGQAGPNTHGPDPLAPRPANAA